MSKIEIRDLTKSYDGKTNILEKISLDVEEGEFYVLVGPSGCGKSTLLRIIAGLEKITDGTLTIDGKVANNMPPKRQEPFYGVPELCALPPHDGERQHPFWVGCEKGAQKRAEASPRRSSRNAGPHPIPEAQAPGALRRPAAAGGFAPAAYCPASPPSA